MKVKAPYELTGFEEQVRDGNIQFCESTDVSAADIESLFEQIKLHAEAKEGFTGEFICITGYSGFWRMRLRVAFDKFGRSKLPRKMKKMYFGAAKTRRRLLPEYYKKPVHVKESNYNFNI